MKLVKILSLALGLMMLVSAAGMAATSMTTTFANIAIAPNAQTGLVGEIDLVPLVVSGTIPAGESITVTYGAPISSTSELAVYILGCAKTFTAAATSASNQQFGSAQACTGTGNPTVTVSVNTTLSTVTIAVGDADAGTPDATIGTTLNTQFARITRVRVNASSLNPTIGQLINATITNSVGVGTITNNFVPVATVQEPISLTSSAFSQPTQTSAADVTTTLSIKELYTNAFETTIAGPSQAVAPTQIIVTVTPPTGFTFNGTNLVSATLVNTGGLNAYVSAVSATGFTIDLLSQNSQSLETIDALIRLTPAIPVTLTPGSVTMTATLAPPTTTFPVAVGPDTDIVTAGVQGGGPLRYSSRLVTVTVGIGATQQNTTTLYAVFSVVAPASENVVGFNTGFAIANTSGTGPMGGVGQPGVITVFLYPADGSAPKNFTTSATKRPGLGLNAADGTLPAGATWNVLLSELVSTAGFTGDSWQGQAKFITNFGNAHGVNFVADPFFQISSHGYPMLVISGTGYDN